MNKKISKIIACICMVTLLTGCSSAKLKNGEEKVVSFKKGSVTADQLYNTLKDKYGISALINLMDKTILEQDYKTTSEETAQVNAQIEQMKQSYKDNEEGFITAIKQYFGVASIDELKDLLSIEYKRSKAITDTVKKDISEEEIKDYYDNNTIGKISAKHILIKPETNDDMSEDEKAKKEEEAKEKAMDIIKKLDNKEDFDKLAKKYSDDSGTKANGGKLEEFDNNSNMDKNFLSAAAKLAKKSYTKEPVKSQYGYHIIYKISEKDKSKLKDVKDDIKESIAKEKLSSDSKLQYEAIMKYREAKGMKFKDSKLKKEYTTMMNNLMENK